MAMLPNPLPRLAADPAGSALGLGLPPGKLIDATADGPWHEPLLWYADGPAEPDAWTSLLPARAAGLHPVLIDAGRDYAGLDHWELAPDEMSYPGDHDPEDVLADIWEEYHDGDWPGIAAAGSPETDPDIRAAEVAAALIKDGTLTSPRAALVHARRSADIPAAIGWCGPLNHQNDVARLCSVLRSWEDRFGVRVLALGYDTLALSVAAPPRTLEAAEAVAAEHYAFCPDNLDQGHHTTFADYARHVLLNAPAWHFRWD
ncbi:DUF4253 domain-containing protein [Streptomyces sp.]|uniref:DUF4253 domain-containing protein n=1 Tax=Streptomyces sp. TaxID=1931 RepID=UPI002F4249A7